MKQRAPEDVIREWCGFHLDDTHSRWVPLHGENHFGPSSCDDGIIAALKREGYEIVRRRGVSECRCGHPEGTHTWTAEGLKGCGHVRCSCTAWDQANPCPMDGGR